MEEKEERMIQNIRNIGGDEVGGLLALFAKLTTRQIQIGAPLTGDGLKQYLRDTFRETNNVDIREVRSEIEALKADVRRVQRKEPRTYLSYRSRTSAGVAMAKKTRIVESPSFFLATKNPLAKAINGPTLRARGHDERDYENTVCHEWFKQFVARLKEEAKGKYLELRHTYQNRFLTSVDHPQEVGEAPDFTTMESKVDPPLAVNTQSVFEVKTPGDGTFSLESVAQAKGYGERVLLGQPNREFVDVVLCNCKLIQFFRVFRDFEDGEHPWKYEESRVCSVQNLEAQNALLRLLESSSIVKLPQFAGYHVTRWLGQGSSSTAYQVASNSNSKESFVLKWHTELSDASKEKCILERLQELLPENLRNHVPKVVQMQRRMLLVSPVCTKQLGLERKDLQTLLALLESCHSHNIMHRDISPDNILRDEREDILLNDWSSASEGDPDTLAGAFYFASDFVLQNLEKKEPQQPFYRPQDDLHSLIRVVAMQVKGKGSELLAQKTPQDVRRFWAGVLTSFWHDCAASAEGLAYGNLCEQLQAFL